MEQLIQMNHLRNTHSGRRPTVILVTLDDDCTVMNHVDKEQEILKEEQPYTRQKEQRWAPEKWLLLSSMLTRNTKTSQLLTKEICFLPLCS